MKDNHSKKTGTSSTPAAHDSKRGISLSPPAPGIVQQQAAVEPILEDDEQRIPETPWHAVQQAVVQPKELPLRFSLPSLRSPVFSSPATVQRVGGLENSANDCFLNAVIQLLEKSYDDLFNPDKNKVQDNRVPVQKAMWAIITELRADKNIPAKTVQLLRKDLNSRGLVANCSTQEDAQELMVRIVEYMIGGSVNNYPYSNGHLLLQGVTTSSEKKDITGNVNQKDYTSDPSNITGNNLEIGNGLIGIDINIYDSFEDFMYFLYGQGTTTQLGEGEELKVLKDGKQVYVNARTEKRNFLVLPNVLTFYVKRFIGGRKITRNFPMPETVILVEEPLLGNKQYKTYTREVVVRHTGSDSISGGHYYAVKNEKGIPVRYNDAKKEVPDNDDFRQGSLYSYRFSGIKKEALGLGEMAPQEARPFGKTTVPNTKGAPLYSPLHTSHSSGGNKPSGGPKPVKGGGFSPFLGQAPIASDTIRGLPNRSRDIGLGITGVDCFINAILQLMAGSYRDLFDPTKNPRTDPVAVEIQKTVMTLIRKINNDDPTPIADNEIILLRDLLKKYGGVASLIAQEDGGELMIFLLGLMMDVTGQELNLPGTDDASVKPVKNNPGEYARANNLSVEALVKHNPVLKEHQISTREREHLAKKDLADPATVPDVFKGKDTFITNWKEESEPAGNIITVDLKPGTDFEEFLFQRYGKGWEKEDFSKDDPAKHELKVQGKATDVGFKARHKKLLFTNLPPTLSFLVKRFTSDGKTQKKDKRDYALPPELFLVEEPASGQKRYKHYELKGIVVHAGASMGQGHYYTHRKEGGEWIKANDQSVNKEASPGADLKQGYIYTYQLKSESDQLQPGQQAAQEKYDLPATLFIADAKLRPTDAMGFAADPKHRNTQAQNAVSGEINALIKQFFPGQKGVFHAGHLFTSTLGGTGDARNLTPMWGSYNTGEYKTFEDVQLTELMKEAKANQRLYISIHAEYPVDDSPEQVFQGLLSTEDIQRLTALYRDGVAHCKSVLRKPNITAQEKRKYELLLEKAKSVAAFYPHFIRACRRIPLQMYNTEARIITFNPSGSYAGRGANLKFKIAGSPRALLGTLDFKHFLGEDRKSILPEAKFYGKQQYIDLKGQDPDEWAVKTYSKMPEPGVFNYITDSGRAAGVDAYIWMDPEGIFSTFKFGGGTEDAGPAPQGFDWRIMNQAAYGASTKIYARAHLLNGKLHGSGNDPQNLSPFTQYANKKMSKDFEEKVKQLPALVTPGKGIFWISRLTGTLKRSDNFNKQLAEKRKEHGTTTDRWRKDTLELQIALAEEEAKMFDTIHFFAYEADVQKDGTLKKGKLLLSAYFKNRLTGEGTTLEDTRYNSLFGANKGAALLQTGYSSERQALKFLSDAIATEHVNADETYLKQTPPIAKDSPAFKLETAFKDIQATIDEQLPLYYTAYEQYLVYSTQVAEWNKEIITHNRQIGGFTKTKLTGDKWKARFEELKKQQEALSNKISEYNKIRNTWTALIEWQKDLYRMVLHHVELTGGAPSYAAVTKTTVAKLSDLAPGPVVKLGQVSLPKRKVEVRDAEGDESGTPDKKKAKTDPK